MWNSRGGQEAGSREGTRTAKTEGEGATAKDGGPREKFPRKHCSATGEDGAGKARDLERAGKDAEAQVRGESGGVWAVPRDNPQDPWGEKGPGLNQRYGHRGNLTSLDPSDARASTRCHEVVSLSPCSLGPWSSLGGEDFRSNCQRNLKQISGLKGSKLIW